MTQGLRIAYGSMAYGLIADNLLARMEKDGIWSGDPKDGSASFPDCCPGGELVRGLSSKSVGIISKEVDENDNHQEEEAFPSLEASTETLVNISDERDYIDRDSDVVELSMGNVSHQFTHVQEELSDDNNSLETAGSFLETEPGEEAKKELDLGKVKEPNYDSIPKPVEREDDICDSGGENLECLDYKNFNDNEDAPRENSYHLLDAESLTPGEISHVPVGEQLHGKPEELKEANEQNACTLVECSDKNNQESSATASFGSHLLAEENGFPEFQTVRVSCGSSVEGLAYLKNNMATHEATDSQVILRKRKVRARNNLVPCQYIFLLISVITRCCNLIFLKKKNYLFSRKLC